MARNFLLATPPYSVEKAIKKLGSNLKTARIRRSLTIEDAAKKIGVGVRAIQDAEKGKASTGIAVYTALLWAYGLLHDFDLLANPRRDAEGLARSLTKDHLRVRRQKGINNDF